MPRRRTFAPDILSFALSMLTALRHPACACQQRRLSGHRHPLPVSRRHNAAVGPPFLRVGKAATLPAPLANVTVPTVPETPAHERRAENDDV
jgi:hypothetical protein